MRLIRKYRGCASLVISVQLLLVTWSDAQVVPGRWEKVDSLSRGEQLRVELKTGAVMPVTFESSDQSRLLVTRRGTEVVIAKSDVRTVRWFPPRWSKGDKIAMGVIVGAGGALTGVCFGNGAGAGCLNWLWIVPAIFLAHPDHPIYRAPEEIIYRDSTPPASD